MAGEPSGPLDASAQLAGATCLPPRRGGRSPAAAWKLDPPPPGGPTRPPPLASRRSGAGRGQDRPRDPARRPCGVCAGEARQASVGADSRRRQRREERPQLLGRDEVGGCVLPAAAAGPDPAVQTRSQPRTADECQPGSHCGIDNVIDDTVIGESANTRRIPSALATSVRATAAGTGMPQSCQVEWLSARTCRSASFFRLSNCRRIMSRSPHARSRRRTPPQLPPAFRTAIFTIRRHEPGPASRRT